MNNLFFIRINVVGDFLVEEDGTRVKWYFNQSKYINIIDSEFDYKHERKGIVEQLMKQRIEETRF